MKVFFSSLFAFKIEVFDHLVIIYDVMMKNLQ